MLLECTRKCGSDGWWPTSRFIVAELAGGNGTVVVFPPPPPLASAAAAVQKGKETFPFLLYFSSVHSLEFPKGFLDESKVFTLRLSQQPNI